MGIQDTMSLHGSVLIFQHDTGKFTYDSNVITQRHRESYAEFLRGDSITIPTHIAVGNKAKLATEDASKFTALKAEIARSAITSKALQSKETARYVAVFPAGEATGEINEFGLFNADETVISVEACDAIGNWTTDGTLSLNLVSPREGVGFLQSNTTGNGASMVSFDNNALSVNAQSLTDATAWLQGWYYIDDVTNIDGASLSVRAYTNIASGSYYEWSPSTTDGELVDNWNWLNLAFDEAVKTSSPNIESNNIVEIRIASTKDNNIDIIERIDNLRIFSEVGDLWARFEPPLEILKTEGSVVSVYWFISMRAGGAEVAFTAFDSETKTVSDSSVGFTTAKIQPTGGADPARQAIVFVRSEDINYLYDGSDPTTSVGIGPIDVNHPSNPIIIEGSGNISNFRMIRNAATDATVEILYLR